MVRIDFDGYELDLTNDLFLQLISNAVSSLYLQSEFLFTSILFGYPEIGTEIGPLFSKDLSMLEQLERKTDATELKAAIQAVITHIYSLIEVENKAKQWIAMILNLLVEDLQQLENYGSLQEVNEEGLLLGNFSFPMWVEREEYQGFIEMSSKLMRALIDVIEVVFDKLHIYADHNEIQYDKHNEQETMKKISQVRILIDKGGLKPELFD